MSHDVLDMERARCASHGRARNHVIVAWTRPMGGAACQGHLLTRRAPAIGRRGWARACLLCLVLLSLGWHGPAPAQAPASTSTPSHPGDRLAGDIASLEQPDRGDDTGKHALRRYIREHCDFAASQWCKLETRNRFKDVMWRDKVPGFDKNARLPTTVFTAFSGMAVGSDKIYFPAGGGSHSYEGNEVYALDLTTLTWERLSDPAPLTAEHRGCPKPETGPWAMHTYASTFVQGKTLHVWGNYPQCRASAPHNSYGAYAAYDLTTNEWGPMRLTPVSDKYDATAKVSYAAPYPGNEAAVVSVKRDGRVYRYDLETGKIIERSDSAGGWIHHGDGVKVGDTIYYHGKGIYKSRNFGKLTRITEKIRAFGRSASFAYYPPDDRILVWNGDGRVWATTTAFRTWTLYTGRTTSGGEPSARKVFGKWAYIPGADVMLGLETHDEMWLFRPTRASNKQQKLEAQGYQCADTLPHWQCPSVQQAVNGGGDVNLPKGVYQQCAVIKKPTRLDMHGSEISGVCANKGTFVQNADFTLANATIRDVRGRAGNEAALRRQKGRTVLKNVRLLNNYNGVLGGTEAPFEMIGGVVSGNGCCGQVPGKPAGRAHGLYLAGGPKAVLKDVTFKAATGEGHLLKTGVAHTLIVNTRFDERGGKGSRVIDAYNGGILEIRNSRIKTVPDDGNTQVIGYDYEARTDWPENRVVIDSDSVIDCAGGQLIGGRHSYQTLQTRIDARLNACW